MIAYENREYPESAIIGPVSLLTEPMQLKGFEVRDNEGIETGSFMSFLEKEASSELVINYSDDNTYFMTQVEMSDLKNDQKWLKDLCKTAKGLTMGGEDFTVTATDLIWILTMSERQEFLTDSPMFT